ncbi:MAG: toxin-antitoxin system YwqK family antitoxin [Flavobacteriales bacterium]
MEKQFTTYILLCFLTTSLFAQNDTIWYNNENKISKKSQASFYRPSPKKEGPLYYVKQYYIDGGLCFEGYTTDPVKNNFEGDLFVYNEMGEQQRTLVFKQAIMIAEKTNHNEKEYYLSYQDSKPDSGSIYYDGIPARIRQYKDGKITDEKTFYADNSTLKKHIIYKYGDKEKEITFDMQGKTIGEALFENNEIKEGEIINFHYKNTEHIYQVLHYSNYKYDYTDNYYSNGKPKSIINTKSPISETFYNLKGEIIGVAYYKNPYSERRIQDGKHISFHRSENATDIPQLISTYQHGKVEKHEHFYENGNLEKISMFDSTGYKLDYEASFTEIGDTIAYLTYRNYQPWEGRNISRNEHKWYKDGVKIKEIVYYNDSKIPFKLQENNTNTYFNLQGEIIATMKLKGQNNSKYAYNGVMVTHNDSLYNFFTYKHGHIVKTEDYRRNRDTRKVFKEIRIYDEHNKNQLQKTIKYFSNGKIKSEIEKEYNKETFGKFYDIKGNLIGEYNYETKHGTLVDYFDISDQIETIKTKENNEIVYEKVYKKNFFAKQSDSNWFYLFFEVDVNKKAVFYNSTGETEYTLAFKNQKPHSGQLFSAYENTVYTFKNGLKEGDYKKIESYDTPDRIVESGQYKLDKKEGIFKFFSGTQLTHTIAYKNDLKHGLSKYYNSDGELTSTLEYIDDKPYDGIFNNNKETVIYKNGLKTERFLKRRYEGNKKEIFKGDSILVTLFFPKTDLVKYTYTLNKNKQLHGPIKRYNQNGQLIHAGVFKEGSLESGTIRLKSDAIYSREVGYYVVTKNENTLYVEIRQRDDVLLLKSTIINVDQNKTLDTYFKLNITNIYDANLM